ncbi:MAG: ATPase, T2SS/T4P/T4SS family, partial [Patescibacteria group bacterium]
MVLDDILALAIQKKSSDIHLAIHKRPCFRVDGKIMEQEEFPVLEDEELKVAILTPLSEHQKQELETERELAFVYSLPDRHRFRVNVFWDQGRLALAARAIPSSIPSMQEVALPQVAYDFTALDKGLVILTGQTGNGKSTSLAAMIDHINQTRAAHIITFEDPIEFVFKSQSSIVRQRELGHDF